MTKQEITSKQVTTKAKPYMMSNELFKSRDVPNFITEHKVFRTPIKVTKIFPSIGLRNFREPCDLIKPMIDYKKENFVSSLLNAMHTVLLGARDEASASGDAIQYLLFGPDREAKMAKIDEVYNLALVVKNLCGLIDNYNNNFERVILMSEGKIVLRLPEAVLDRNNKPLFKQNESLFKVFAKLRDQFTAVGLNFARLEDMPEFKTFCSENVPNKQYQVVFSADGTDGAWDLLTMSMRGIKSCQRWDGDYPRCLIGSILSKFVGIIYITSGADYQGYGDKMMRRALVRYAIDADERKPCILIDRLYPQQTGADVDEETLAAFKKALASKTELPIHFAPTLGTKARHFYIPFEKIRGEVTERDWTYQDTPLKTNLDFQLHVLVSASNEDISRYINCFKVKLVTQMGEHLRNIANRSQRSEDENIRTIINIRLNTSIDKFNEEISKYVFDKFSVSAPRTILDPKEHYRKYLMQLILHLKNIKRDQQANLVAIIGRSTSRQVEAKSFIDFLFDNLIKNIITQEIRTLFN